MRPVRATALVALLACVPLLAGVGQAQEEAIDLAVVSVRVPVPPSWADGAPTDSSVEVTLRNEGDSPLSGYQLQYWWVDGRGERPLNGGQEESIDVRYDAQDETLQPGEQMTFTFPWKLQPDQVGKGTVRVEAQPAGAPGQRPVDTDPSDNKGSGGVFVASHATQATALGEARKVRLDETVFVRFEVRNDGNVDEPVHLSLAPPSDPSEQRVELELDVTDLVVPPGGTRTTTLYVTYPYRGDPSDFEVRPAVVFESGYGRVERVETPPISSSLEETDPGDFGARLAAPAGSAFGTAAEPAEAVLVATNTGTADDTYRVSAETPAGWSTEVHPDRLGLAPGESAQVVLTATPGPSLAQGSNATVRVILTPESPTPDVVAGVDVRVRGPSPELGAVRSSPARVYAGDEVVLTVDLHNRGDDAVPGGGLTVRFMPEDGPERVERVDLSPIGPGATWSQAVAAGTFPGGRVDYVVEWDGPGFTLAGDGAFDVHAPQVTITSPTPQAGMPGERVSYRLPPYVFVVRNDGAHAETFRISLDGSGGDAVLLGAAEVGLEPGESHVVPFEVALPRPAGPTEEVGALLHVRVAQRPTSGWNASVATAVEDLLPPRVSVGVRPGAWERSQPMEVAAEVTDDGMVRSVELLVTDPSGTDRTVAMREDAGGRWLGVMRFTSDGNHTLTVRATDRAGNEGDVRPWTVDVQPTPPPRLGLPPVAAPWPVAGTFPVEVTSEHGVQRLQYDLVQGDRTVAAGDVPVVDGRAEVVLSGASGNATLRLTAVDEAGGRAVVEVDLRLVEAGAAGDPAPPVARSSPGPGAVWLALAAVVAALRRRSA